MFLPPRHRRYCRVACAVVAIVVVSVVRIARVCNCLQCLMFEENMTDVISCAFITSCKYYAVLWIIALKIWIVLHCVNLLISTYWYLFFVLRTRPSDIQEKKDNLSELLGRKKRPLTMKQSRHASHNGKRNVTFLPFRILWLLLKKGK